jgi:hypothetical protein
MEGTYRLIKFYKKSAPKFKFRLIERGIPNIVPCCWLQNEVLYLILSHYGQIIHLTVISLHVLFSYLPIMTEYLIQTSI